MEMERRPREGDELTRLYKASIEGSLITFNSLIQKDPLTLNRISPATFNETPLYITTLLGHLTFTRQLLLHKPKLASELDSHNRSPLHLASAEGHAELVQALLQENGGGDQSMCLAKDQDGKIPLHYAALRGRIDVIELLINARMMPDGPTLERACSWEHHILHLAVMLKQAETVRYLLAIPGVKAEADDIVNNGGLKALELLENSPGTNFIISDKIRRIFKDSGLAITQEVADLAEKKLLAKSPKLGKVGGNWFGFRKYKGDRTEDRRGSIMIVSTVISTMTYNTTINPPGGVWQART
ncbi:hypothetical protein TIFTF001_000592 [Ficus carica]|uniref:PGG domain-containing protein n=1 Tax=Ficus carica TaxID=3494 RepID=A0AA87ZB59_FICCA|nr:hypothetical protein TIFTF001_000592 [Ficus carica]